VKKNLWFHIAFWLFLWITFFLVIYSYESFYESLSLSGLVVLSLLIPIYIHDYIFDYFVLNKRYYLYLIITIALVIFFGTMFKQLQLNTSLNLKFETYATLLFMMVFFTGTKYFRLAALQKIRIKEEEERRISAENELKEMETRQANAELNLLKSQVNPHFLFNTLNSIYSLTFSNSNLAGDSVIKLADLMRYLLESSGKRKVLVKHELEFLKNYIDLEKVRLGNKCEVNYTYSGNYDGKIISPLILIPFIENCFKHGVSANLAENIIDIGIEVKENVLYLNSANNIAPKRLDPSSKKTKTGIANVKKRLKLLYPKQYQLSIDSEGDKFEVKLKLEI